jgi:hypothetical protein
MARTVSKQAPAKAGRGKSVPETGKKAPAVNVDAELDALAAEALDLEAKERDQFHVSRMLYVSIVGRTSEATMKSKSGYIPGAKIGDLVTSTKEILGASIEVTVLGIFKIYGQFEPDTVDKKGGKIQGALKRYVMPEEAIQARALAQEAGYQVDNFSIPLPNGHTLRPMHWIYLYLHDLPEVDNAVFSLRSTGNKIAGELAKIIQSSDAQHIAELRFELTSREESNDKGEWSVPEFNVLDQRNFKVADGRFVPVRGGLAKADIAKLVKLSTDQRKAYNACDLISKSDVLSLFQGPRKALPAGKGYEEDNDEGEAVNF